MGSGRDTATAIGLLLEVIGLGIATAGLASTYRTLLGRRLLSDLRRDVQAWLDKVLGRQPPMAKGGGAGATVWAGAAGGGHGRLNPPPEDASPEDKLAHLLADVERLWSEVAHVREKARADVERSEAGLRSDIGEVAEGLQDATAAADRVEVAMAGRNGAGLRVAAVGLSITLCGVVVSLAGMHW